MGLGSDIMLLVGTAGYSYKDWIGPFYPEGIKATDMLEYYSRHFNFVELNSTYYHMPSTRLFEAIENKTPDNFKLSVKLNNGFTHGRTMGPADAEQFIYAMKPVIESNKLVCILAQFPYSFHCTKENGEYLKRMRDWFPDINVNIEFRSQDWLKRGVMEYLKSNGLGFVCVDEPDSKGLVKKVAETTSDIAYVRFHGRNSEKWYAGEGSERYDYLYSVDELEEWTPKIHELKNKSSVVVVSFNNHPIGSAIQNARIMMKLLSKK